MKLWAGVTDNNWYKFLSEENYDEVNFWRPSPGPYFKTLPAGTPFLFKLKAPFNHIAGGGTFIQYSSLPLEMAWDAFGEKNGAPSFRVFDKTIREYRRLPKGPLEIGCNVLVEPFFFPKDQWIELPAWSRSIVQGKTFDTETEEGAWLWNEVHQRVQLKEIEGLLQEPSAEYGDAPRFGELFLTRSRLGQGAFKVLVSEAYGRRCAITGESTFPVLEAAHIQAYGEGGPHRISNGMLLRSDFHKLFDAGLVTVTPELRVRVSDQIKDKYFNGKAYYRLHDQLLAVMPERITDQPDPAFLKWHLQERFVG